jgi:Fe-S-cluster containining protein
MLKREAGSISKATLKPIDMFAHRIEKHEPYVYEMKKTENGKCVFLENDACTIYTSRPLICRYYPFELKPGKNVKYAFSFTSECPGIGGGKSLGKVYFKELFRLAQDQLS